MNVLVYGKQEDIIPAIAITHWGLQERTAETSKFISNRMSDNFEVDTGNDPVYLIGYTFTNSTIKTLVNIIKQRKVIWLDNHTTSFEVYAKLKEMNIDLSNLEAVIAKNTIYNIVWEYFYPNKDIPMCINFLNKWEEYDMEYDAVRWFRNALIVHDDYNKLDSLFWKELVTNPDTKLVQELISTGRYISIWQKRNEIRNLSEISIYRMEDDTEFAILNSMGDRYVFDIAYQIFDGCILYHYDGLEYIYQVFSKTKNLAGRYALKHGGKKEFRSWMGSFKKNKDDNYIYWDYLDSRRVSSLLQHPKYREFINNLSD